MPMPWIKLYTKILDDYKFHHLSDHHAFVVIGLMLVSAKITSEPEPEIVKLKYPPKLSKAAYRASETLLCNSLNITRDTLFDDFKALGKQHVFARYSYGGGKWADPWIFDWEFSEHYKSLFDIGYDRLVGPEWQELRDAVLERDANTCQYCGALAEHVDHVVPVCKGGGNTLDNLVAACAKCNLSKGGRTPQEAGMEL